MENIILKEVSGRCELRKFIKFPNKLFKEVPTYIPPLMGDELGLLTSKNPSLDHCDLKMWLAYHDHEIVGRVAGIINYSVNERWNKKAVRFGWFDFIEDYDVFSQLLNAVADEGLVSAINASSFIAAHHLKGTSSINKALAFLLDNEYVYRTERGYMVYDRFMGIWLRRI